MRCLMEDEINDFVRLLTTQSKILIFFSSVLTEIILIVIESIQLYMFSSQPNVNVLSDDQDIHVIISVYFMYKQW